MGDVSAYKVLIDSGDLKNSNMPRKERTRALLSGAMKPQTPDIQPTFPVPRTNFPNPGFQNQQNPISQPLTQASYTQSQFAPPTFSQNNFTTPFQPLTQPGYAQNQFLPQNNFANPGNLGNLGNNMNQGPFGRSIGFNPTRTWGGETNAETVGDRNRFSRFSGFPNSSRKSIIRDSRSRRFDRSAFSKGYHSKSKNDSDHHEITKEDIQDIIQKMDGPTYLKTAFEQDVMDEIRRRENKGYRVPRDYDKNKHDLEASEMALYSQQAEREHERDENRAKGVIRGIATIVPTLFDIFHIKWLKTNKLQKFVEDGLEQGDFEGCLEKMGRSLKDTWLDNPKIAAAFVFGEKLAKANKSELDDENDSLQDIVDEKAKSSVKDLGRQTQSFMRDISRKPFHHLEKPVKNENPTNSETEVDQSKEYKTAQDRAIITKKKP